MQVKLYQWNMFIYILTCSCFGAKIDNGSRNPKKEMFFKRLIKVPGMFTFQPLNKAIIIVMIINNDTFRQVAMTSPMLATGVYSKYPANIEVL